MFDPFKKNGEGPDAEVPLLSSEFEKLPAFYTDKAWVITLLSRPGAVEFMQEVEWTLFVPDTDRNALFGLILSKFPAGSAHPDEMATIAFPMEDLDKVREIAEKYNFSLDPNVGILSFSEGKTHWFGFPEGPNVFCVQGFSPDIARLANVENAMVRRGREGKA